MQTEHGPMRHLEELAPGTRVRLAPGRVGTLLEVNFTRAVVELDRGDDRRREIAPGSEVEVLTIAAREETGSETASPSAEMRNTGRGRLGSPTRARYASETGPARAGRSACPICGMPIDGRARYCSSAHRQRAYRQRREARAPAATVEQPQRSPAAELASPSCPRAHGRAPDGYTRNIRTMLRVRLLPSSPLPYKGI
jgi:hypothetical protein